MQQRIYEKVGLKIPVFGKIRAEQRRFIVKPQDLSHIDRRRAIMRRHVVDQKNRRRPKSGETPDEEDI